VTSHIGYNSEFVARISEVRSLFFRRAVDIPAPCLRATGFGSLPIDLFP
jgi:hypothetical protein